MFNDPPPRYRPQYLKKKQTVNHIYSASKELSFKKKNNT